MSDLRELSEIVLSLVPKKRVFIQGSAFVDMIIQIEELPHSGADVEGHYRKTTVGGCSFNVADVLQKLGLPFDALMPVGQGMFADLVEKTFRERGYPVVRVPGAVDNGWCLSLAERSGERTFISMFGIERHMEPEWFDAFDLASYDFIYVSGYQAEGENGAMLLSLLKTRMGPATTVVFDPGPRVHDMPRERIDAFFDLGAMFTVNADEAQALTGEKTPEAAAAALWRRSGRPAVVTDGGRGAVVADGDVRRIPGFPVAVVDTIGSGDAHTGGVIAGLLCGLTLDESVLLANAVASFVTGSEGAATAPTRGELLSAK